MNAKLPTIYFVPAVIVTFALATATFLAMSALAATAIGLLEWGSP